jgi:hypothetical protein
MPPECTQSSDALGRWLGSSEGVSSAKERILEIAPIEVSRLAQKDTKDFIEVPRVNWTQLEVVNMLTIERVVTYNIDQSQTQVPRIYGVSKLYGQNGHYDTNHGYNEIED